MFASIASPFITRLPCIYSSDFTFNIMNSSFDGNIIRTIKNITFEECIINCILYDGCTCINHNTNDSICEIVSDSKTLAQGVMPSSSVREGWIAQSPMYRGRRVTHFLYNMQKLRSSIFLASLWLFLNYAAMPWKIFLWVISNVSSDTYCDIPLF